MMLLLTKDTTPIIGWIASLLGYIMNGIFNVQSAIGIENLGLCIIFFTIVVYVLMIPLTVQQQKFSKLQAIMNPEIQEIQKKYKDKKDQDSMQKMQEETQTVYQKYGVNPAGSCVQLVVQLPILFALYSVIRNIPAYVTNVREALMPLADKLVASDGALEFFTDAAAKVGVKFTELSNLKVIDTIYKFRPDHWDSLTKAFPDLSGMIGTTHQQIDHFNFFLGLNIVNNPMDIIKDAISSKTYLLVILAALIPILSAVTQWLNTKLMGTVQTGGDGNDATANTMKTMNTVMPLMFAVFSITLPVGLGIYWIAGSVVRSIIQIVINHHLDKVGVEEIVEKNQKKADKKREKRGFTAEQMNANAKMNTRSIGGDAVMKKAKADNGNQKSGEKTQEQPAARPEAKPGSLAEKARMVEKYNSSHTKK